MGFAHNRRYQTLPHLCSHSKPVLERLTLKMLWILRTPLMRRTAPMVLVLGVLLSGAVAAAAPTESQKSGLKSDKSSHSKLRATRPAPAAAKAKSRLASSHRPSKQNTAKTSVASARAAAHNAGARASTAHEPAHRLAPPAPRSRAASGRSGRRKAQTRAALLSNRSRIRASLRNRDRELPISPAPVSEVISLHRRDLGLSSPLRGSFASLERQNEKSEGEDGLERIQDEDDLQDRIAHNFLVPVPTSADLAINQNLPESHRYCRPWTAQFLTDLAGLHAARFHGPLEVSSAVRTVDYQKQLERINGNAAAAEGDVASPHLTGSAVDIPKSNMTRDEIAWMRTSLLALEQAGKLDVEEEFLQRCFHITVYKSYAAETDAATPPVEAVSTLAKPAPRHRRSPAPTATPASAPASARARAAAHPSPRAPARPAKPLPA